MTIPIQFVLSVIDKSAYQPDKYFSLCFLKFSKGNLEIRRGLFRKERTTQDIFNRNKHKNLIMLHEKDKSHPINIKIFFILTFNGYPVQHNYFYVK